jgi:hypothetical protein
VTWAEWLTLPVREGDNVIGTVKGPVRVPSVLVLAKFDKVPKSARSSACAASGNAMAVCANTPAASCAARRQHRPRRAAFSRWADVVGKLRARRQTREQRSHADLTSRPHG